MKLDVLMTRLVTYGPSPNRLKILAGNGMVDNRMNAWCDIFSQYDDDATPALPSDILTQKGEFEYINSWVHQPSHHRWKYQELKISAPFFGFNESHEQDYCKKEFLLILHKFFLTLHYCSSHDFTSGPDPIAPALSGLDPILYRWVKCYMLDPKGNPPLLKLVYGMKLIGGDFNDRLQVMLSLRPPNIKNYLLPIFIITKILNNIFEELHMPVSLSISKEPYNPDFPYFNFDPNSSSRHYNSFLPPFLYYNLESMHYKPEQHPEYTHGIIRLFCKHQLECLYDLPLSEMRDMLISAYSQMGGGKLPNEWNVIRNFIICKKDQICNIYTSIGSYLTVILGDRGGIPNYPLNVILLYTSGNLESFDTPLLYHAENVFFLLNDRLNSQKFCGNDLDILERDWQIVDSDGGDLENPV